ncbi:MAG: hypothetical protein ACO1ON_13155 [Nocardioides sp.]
MDITLTIDGDAHTVCIDGSAVIVLARFEPDPTFLAATVLSGPGGPAIFTGLVRTEAAA